MLSFRRPWPRLLVPAFLVVIAILGLAAPISADVCESSTQPAATLLFPYFEVDLADANGRTTLLSINNAGVEPVVARVTLFTNAAYPTLGFDLVLDPKDLQSLNLRNLLQGQIPATDIDAALPECADPPVLPELDATGVADLRAWHTGAADSSGLCRGEAGDEASLATGYVTVDAMNRCSPFFTFPGDDTVHEGGERYFEDGGTGLASNENVLWGDLIFIDPGQDAAQSVAAVHVRADAERFQGSVRTFYGSGIDDRAPLPSTYRGRFLAGQPTGTTTSFQLWLDPVNFGSFPEEGFECGERLFYMNQCTFLEAQAYDEEGAALDELFVENAPLVLRRLEIAPNAGSGFIEMRFQELLACFIIPIGLEPRQAVMIPLLQAENRFSAATAAVALDSTCPEL